MKPYQPPKLTPERLRDIRARWFKAMSEDRATVAAMTITERTMMERIVDAWPWPQMTIYGGPDGNSYPPIPEAYKMAKIYKIDVRLLNPWLITEDGWNAYLHAFQNLPELVESYPQASGGNLGKSSVFPPTQHRKKVHA